MNKYKIRRAFVWVPLSITLGITIAATDFHRHALGFVWPSITAFVSNYITF